MRGYMNTPEIVLDNIRRRRTVKPVTFLQGTISDEIINEILESANWAPNHGKTEPWRLTVFSGSGIDTYVQIIEDVNGNNKWDPGNYDLKTQSERLFFRKLEELRAGWDLESEVSVDK